MVELARCHSEENFLILLQGFIPEFNFIPAVILCCPELAEVFQMSQLLLGENSGLQQAVTEIERGKLISRSVTQKIRSQ